MAKTLWVQANRFDRKVILSEADQSHPGTHEIFIVGYEDPRFDADGNPVIPANPAIEVGDTPGVRQRIAEKDLIEVSGPSRLTAQPRIQTVASPTEALGSDVADRLAAAGYDNEESIRDASDEELRAIPGIGDATFRRIRAAYPAEA